ncbi:MAG: hypothetical protein J0L52_04455 [Caulobacterales bacterium]|nr:hypothetical protein [Caulobacterales bacterium]
MRLTLAISALAALGLAACEMPTSTTTEAPGAAASGEADTNAPPLELGGVDLTGDISVLGTEPLWSVGFEGQEMSYSGLDRPEQTAPRPAPVVSETAAIWTATTEAGNLLVVTLSLGDCSDGMSDRSYPLVAEVVISGETLNGCAGSTAWLHSIDENGDPVS